MPLKVKVPTEYEMMKDLNTTKNDTDISDYEKIREENIANLKRKMDELKQLFPNKL